MQRRSLAASLYELLSSMRFAISLLTVLAIASVIGTVIKQNEAFNAYLNQFGPFWFPVFETLGLYGVYNSGWFLVILAFLVASTSACLLRQAAPMAREMRRFGETAREQSLRAFGHHTTFTSTLPLPDRRAAVGQWLEQAGYRFRENARDDGVLLAAKRGSHSRIGYFLAHGAIVLICIGGLMDGNLPLTLQMYLGDKTVSPPNRLIADIPETSRLSEDNWSYRGNLFVPEGRSAQIAVLGVGDGILLQPLPFTVSLKKFHIEHYDNGMPRRFASDIVLHDNASGVSTEHTIEVNRPLHYQGVTLYQASFDDGGSRLKLVARSLLKDGDVLPFELAVGEARAFKHPDYEATLELTDFRAFNVEDMGGQPRQNDASGLDAFRKHLGSGAKPAGNKALRNVGPSFQYKLRDPAGQALEFRNYMLPIEQDGRWYLFAGVRRSQAEGFSYLRLPLDEEGQIDTWFALHRLWLDPARREQVADRYARRNTDGTAITAEMGRRLAETARQTMTLFAEGGFEAVSGFITASVPEADRNRAADVFIKILQGAMWESWMLAREQAALAPLEISESRAAYLRDALAALSDARHYGAPLYLQLSSYEHVQATVLQVTRSPGQSLVYLGSLLLVLGVFAMFYIRERRLFVLLKGSGDVLIAMSSNRRTLEFDDEFERHTTDLAALLAAPHPATEPSGAAT